MFGVGNYPAHPPALTNMLGLIEDRLPTVPVFNDVPQTYPNTFITVERVGGDDIAHGHISAPLFVFQCYSVDSGGAEELAELLLSVLKSAQFTKLGTVQFRKFELAGGLAAFPNPRVPGRRRWQFSGTFTLN